MTPDETNSKTAESYFLVRWLFLRGLGVIHLTAFGSYAFQIIGLNGAHGILPTHDMMTSVAQSFGPGRFYVFPTLAWLNSSDAFLQGMTVAGSLISLLVILGIATAPALVVLAVLWLSLVTGGGEFTGFQSDGMLVEGTVLSLFLVPWQLFEPPWPVPFNLRRQTPPPRIALWLLRFMLFRIMFASGLVKIGSGDLTWRNLTATQFHFETQPIPTPLAWLAHQSPPLLHKFFVIGMFVSELVAPLLMFAGRNARILAAFLMFMLHFSIALTGNYTFLNYLLMLLCITLLNDRLVTRFLPKAVVDAIQNSRDERQPGRFREIVYKAAAILCLIIAGNRLASTVFGGNVLLPPVREVIALAEPLRVVDSYGLFAVMTTSRPEIVFQGSADGVIWKSYEFKYKPGDDMKRPPPWVAPHMPRLDWRLWFAAMGPVSESPWVLALVLRLLEGSPDVQIFFVSDPFPDKPPKFIRAFVYDYHFTDPATLASTGCWWRRDNERVFLPPLTLENAKLNLAF